MHQFLALNRSLFTLLSVSAGYCALLCVSNSDCSESLGFQFPQVITAPCRARLEVSLSKTLNLWLLLLLCMCQCMNVSECVSSLAARRAASANSVLQWVWMGGWDNNEALRSPVIWCHGDPSPRQLSTMVIDQRFAYWMSNHLQSGRCHGLKQPKDILKCLIFPDSPRRYKKK